MIMTIIITTAILTGLFHIAWYAGSYLYKNRALPDRVTVKKYQAGYVSRLNITVDASVMEETDIEANGIRLRLTVFSVDQYAPTLVFMPGTSVYAQLYIEFLYGMYLKGFNIVALDPRGHGMSSGPRGHYTINELTDDLLACVDYAKKRFHGKVAVMGSSQGGIAAFYTAARGPAIDAVVCNDFADLNGSDNVVLSQLRPPAILRPFLERLGHIYRNYAVPVSLYLNLRKESFKDGTNLFVYSYTDPQAAPWITLKSLISLMHTDMPRPVEQISVPTMLVYGGRDNIFPPEYLEAIYNRLTCEKKALFLEDQPHMLLINHPERVIPPVSDWLKKTLGENTCENMSLTA